MRWTRGVKGGTEGAQVLSGWKRKENGRGPRYGGEIDQRYDPSTQKERAHTRWGGRNFL